MIGLDTNIIIRYLTQDDPLQSELANKLINKSIKLGDIFWISQITLCETIWVLERAYKIPKNDLAGLIYSLLQTPQLIFENHDAIWEALQDFKNAKNAGFADCLIGRQNKLNNCKFTYTSDKEAASDLATFQLLKK